MFSHKDRYPLGLLAASVAGLLGVLMLLLLASTANVAAQTPTPPRSELYLNIGKSYEGAAQPAKAAEYYLKALEADPTNAAALDALRVVVRQQQADDPRLAVADQYVAARQYDKAVELYLKILADRPAQLDIQQRALAAIDEARGIRSQLEPDSIKVGKGMLFAVLTLLGLLLLFGVTRLVRRYRKGKLDASIRRYVILPFTNATGVQALSGVQEGVRSAITDWLHTNHAAVHDSALVVESASMPDVGLVAKLVNWFSTQITPTPDASFVDGTLLGARTGTGGQEVGLTVRLRSKNGGQIERVRTFWNPASSTGDPNAYIQLAYTAATWIYEPAEVMQCGPADLLHQSNTHGVQAQLQEDTVRARAEMAESIKLAQKADAEERALATPVAAGGLAAGGTRKGPTIVTPSRLASERAALYQQYLNEIK